jgi:hypothetical protein
VAQLRREPLLRAVGSGRFVQVHTAQRHELQSTLERTKMPSVKYSSQVLDMMRMEQRMFKGGYVRPTELIVLPSAQSRYSPSLPGPFQSEKVLR